MRRYPSHSNVFFFKKLLRYGFFHGVTTPAVFGLFLHACRAVGGAFSYARLPFDRSVLNDELATSFCDSGLLCLANHDQVITSAIRGFSGGELVSLLQFRPSMALLGLLHHRLVTVDDPYIQLRK